MQSAPNKDMTAAAPALRTLKSNYSTPGCKHRMGAYPRVEDFREANKNYRKRAYSDATQQIKREAARALDEIIAEKRRAVVGVGTCAG